MKPSQFPEIQAYPNLKRILEWPTDGFYEDLRFLMKNPGLNLTTCMAILNIIAGSSVCFYYAPDKTGTLRIGLETEKERDRGDRFKGLVRGYYPWNYEYEQYRPRLPSGTAMQDDGADILWKLVRNPLTHSLGVGRKSSQKIVVRKQDKRLSDDDLAAYENTKSRPLELVPTIDDTTINGIKEISINVPCLYWGLHSLLQKLFSDKEQMNNVESWYLSNV